MRRLNFIVLTAAAVVALAGCSLTNSVEDDAKNTSENTSTSNAPIETKQKPVKQPEPRTMNEQVQAWLAEGLIKPTDDPNIWQATKPLPRPQFSLKHEKPIYPEAGYVYNEAGAEAVAIYWGKLFEYMINTYDLTDFYSVCPQDFERCVEIYQDIQESNSKGSWNAEYTEVNPEVLGYGIPKDDTLPGEFSVRTDYRRNTSYYFDAGDNTLNKNPTDYIKRWSNLSYLNEKWLIAYTEIVDK